MTDDTTLTPAEKLKQALAAKKAQQGAGFNGQLGAKAGEKIAARQANALNKPAFKRMSKRG